MSLGLMWTQYSINIFIYAYRSDQYRNAYWDILVIVFPCLPKLLENWKKMFPKKDEYELARKSEVQTKETAIVDSNPSHLGSQSSR